MKGTLYSVLLIASLPVLTEGLSLSQELLLYTTSVIQYYAQKHPGQFECVFYDVSAGTDNGWFGTLLASPALGNVAKYVIDDNFRISYSNFTHKPPLTVIYVGERNMLPSMWTNAMKSVFYILDSNSELMVLVNVENLNASIGFEYMLEMLKFDKVTFVGTKSKRVLQMGFGGEPYKLMRTYPKPEDLIISNVRKLNERHIGITFNADVWHPVLTWVTETARFLKTRIRHYPTVCGGPHGVSDCVHQLSKALHIDIVLDRMASNMYAPNAHRMIFDSQPMSQVLVVPQGRPINAVEMFTKPFTWETWMVLLMTITLLEMISLVFPVVFKNDPFMLLVCGFERYNLHHASLKEKFTLLPLIIFFFLVFNAYETKLISFMTEKPSIGNLKTLNEVAKSNLKIIADLSADERVVNDTFLGPLVINVTQMDGLLLDGVHAYLSNTVMAPVLVSLVQNYDFKLRRPKYVQVNERRVTSVICYWIGLKSPFAETFYYTQKVFFEAGLLGKWQNEMDSQIATNDRSNFGLVETDQASMLTSEDLISTWAMYAIGLCVSFLVFWMELVLKWCKRFKIRGRTK
uniref:ionotropic receptor 145 precursor n=1 Tax=Aedes aegypti TaxID=7159 RepID=UPI000C283663|nr:ionotropic receptor 145 precursor [Aedes aegypti]